jgi:hypothetical protein
MRAGGIMESGFGWMDVVYAVARLFILASLVYFLHAMIRTWRLLEVWSPETLRALMGRGGDESPRL